jgi:hypothetical protein
MAEKRPCEHKCHVGLGLNAWVEECPVCHCPNPKYDPANADRLREEFFQQMETCGWTDFRECVIRTGAYVPRPSDDGIDRSKSQETELDLALNRIFH